MEEIKALQEFLAHVTESVEGNGGLLDTLHDGDGHYLDKFDLKLEMNGKSISLGLHADLYDRITTFLEEVIEEEQQ